MEGIRGADDHESVKDKVVATYIPTASLGHPINELNTLHGGGGVSLPGAKNAESSNQVATD